MLKWFTRFSLKNGAVIVIAMLMVIFGGIYSYSRIPNASYPSVDIPWVHVTIAYPGATPKQVSTDITKALESKFASLTGIQKLYSFSDPGHVEFDMEFDMSRPLKDADRDIQDVLNQVKLPTNAQKPDIENSSISNPAVYTFSVASNRTDLSHVQSYVESSVKPQLAAVTGVSDIQVSGTTKKNIYVEVNLQKLKHYGITWQQVQQALLANNFASPIGSLNVGQKTMPIVVSGGITSINQIKAFPVVLMKQNTSGITDAFNSIQSGFEGVGSTLSALGSNEGYIQAEIQYMQAIQGLAASFFADATKLQSLQAMQRLSPSPAIDQKVSALSAKVKGEQEEIQTLQTRLKELGQHVQFPSAPSTSTKMDKKPSSNVQIQANVVRLGDIADVVYRSDPTNSFYARTDGKPGVVVQVIPGVNANTIQVVHDVKQAMAHISMPSDYHVSVLDDESKSVKDSVNSMVREAALGALFAVIVTLLFLRDIRATLVAIFSIPLSILAAVIVMNALGYSLNLLTLSGIAVAVGRVVDDSIVVIENIYRRLKRSELSGTTLIEESTQEVGAAITSSTVTTIAVFLPMTVVPGIVGHVFAPFAWTVIIALSFSLLVALMVVPLVARMTLLRVKPSVRREGWMQRGYRSVLHWSLAHKWIVILISVLLLVESGFAATKLAFNFLPSGRVTMFEVDATMPTASNIESTDSVTRQIEQIISKTPGVKTYQSLIHTGNAAVLVFVNESVQNSQQFANRLRNKLKTVHGSHRITVSGSSGPGDSSVHLMLVGSNYQQLVGTANKVASALQKIPGLADVTTSVTAGAPQLQVTVDANRAGMYGLDPMTVAGSIRNMIGGDSVTNVTLNGQSTDVNLMAGNGGLSSLKSLGEQTILSPTGQQVRIDQIADLSAVNGPNSIERLNQQEFVQVSGTITSDNQGAVTHQIDAAVKNVGLPTGVTATQEGANEEINQGFVNLGIAMAVSFILVLIAMLITFSEWSAPLAIVFALPFAIVGGFNALWITRQPLGMPGMIGFMMLIGIIVTNAIVLIDRVKRNQMSGLPVREALLEAGAVRLRPILMTATATIGALIPLALTSDAGLISKSLAIVVIGGLLTSTLLTLVIVPIMYEWFVRVRSRVWKTQQEASPKLNPEVSMNS